MWTWILDIINLYKICEFHLNENYRFLDENLKLNVTYSTYKGSKYIVVLI